MFEEDKACAIAALVLGFAGVLYAQPHAVSNSSLCDLQTSVPAGEHRTVRVEGVYLSGSQGEYLVDPNCSYRGTWVEFELSSPGLMERLNKLADQTKQKQASGEGDPVLVVFTGTFYGPRAPDPNLPVEIRKVYRLFAPGWDPMNNAKTKIAVDSIESAKKLPAGHPCASSREVRWPCWQTAPPSPEP